MRLFGFSYYQQLEFHMGFDQPNCVFLLMNLTDVCYQKLGNTLNVQTLLAISWWCLPTKIGFSHVFPIFPGEEF